RQIFVIPAQAGIQKPDISAMFSRFLKPDDWIPACAGMTNPYGFGLLQEEYIFENQKIFRLLIPNSHYLKPLPLFHANGCRLKTMWIKTKKES
ncbi:MAG: hypothetical protein Q4G28_12465, partial [Neisseria sp.]|nr:hypothetical protein [Neisseria sp.]